MILFRVNERYALISSCTNRNHRNFLVMFPDDENIYPCNALTNELSIDTPTELSRSIIWTRCQQKCWFLFMTINKLQSKNRMLCVQHLKYNLMWLSRWMSLNFGLSYISMHSWVSTTSNQILFLNRSSYSHLLIILTVYRQERYSDD